jgi:tetratricopeptide (TPR) repeat protein
MRDDLDGANRFLGQALEIEESLGNPPRLCDAYRHMGMVLERQGKLDDASRYFERAEKIARSQPDDVRLGLIIHQRARLLERTNSLAETADLYELSLAIRQRRHDIRGSASTLHQLGNVHFRLGNTERAIECYQRALDLEEKTGDALGKATTLMQLAHVAEERFIMDLAYKSLLLAKPLLRRLHSPLGTEVDARLARVQGMLAIADLRRVEEEVALLSGVPVSRIEASRASSAKGAKAGAAPGKPRQDSARELAAMLGFNRDSGIPGGRSEPEPAKGTDKTRDKPTQPKGLDSDELSDFAEFFKED